MTDFQVDGANIRAVNRNIQQSTRLLVLLAMVACCVGCDQATKKFATAALRPAGRLSYFGDTFRVEYAQNPGAFLGLASGLSPHLRFWLLIGLNSVLLGGVVAMLIARWNMPRSHFLAMSAILGGGLGNLIDRVVWDGQVIDFLNLGVGVLRTGIFNVADMAITGGVLALIACRAMSQSSATAPE